ncbi:MAG: beta-ketoacyl-ACP synthase [Fibrobacter sp.]|nr:beta-ketoacyl-ACP synthase [Fibrobacter sp.]
MTRPLFIQDFNAVCALGSGKDAIWKKLLAGDRSAIQERIFGKLSRYAALLTSEVTDVPVENPFFDNRVNRISLSVLQFMRPKIEAAIQNYGKDRIGVFLGSCDNGSEASLAALQTFSQTGSFPENYSMEMQQADFPARFIADYFELNNVIQTHSTACASSASAFASARNMIYAGVCDAAIVGGVDIVSLPVMLGFSSLEAVSPEPCNPFSANRSGITLGEAGAFFLVTKEADGASLKIIGIGESADADHMTAPRADGAGAILAMQGALSDAELSPSQIDYLNLHGTGTKLNDAMESLAVASVFSGTLPVSSTKAMTGHTLGAAGALELAICGMTLLQTGNEKFLPPHLFDGVRDETLPSLNLVPAPHAVNRVSRCMSNSFAFGGCNVSLVMERT